MAAWGLPFSANDLPEVNRSAFEQAARGLVHQGRLKIHREGSRGGGTHFIGA